MATFNTMEISLASQLTDGAISFDRLMQITEKFSDERKLGTAEPRRKIIGKQPEARKVYKAILEDGGVIAVKKYEADAPGTENREEYQTKVKSLMLLNHENIVRLLAFCYEKREGTTQYDGRNYTTEIVESLLCYEYLHNGSLEKNIFGESASSLDWNTRFKIIKGISEGIQFLHMLPQPIIHLDLNPQNVLLDHNMVPKITNFGSSRLVNQNQTRVQTKTSLGSIGYKAPEHVEHGEISVRVDIYSLGLIILQITTRVENCPSFDQKSARKYIKSVKAGWSKKKMDERIMIDYPDMTQDSRDQLKRCIDIGLKCVDPDQDMRPKIVEIVNMLNGQ